MIPAGGAFFAQNDDLNLTRSPTLSSSFSISTHLFLLLESKPLVAAFLSRQVFDTIYYLC